MATHERLGEFLQARRAQLQPEDVGLSTYEERRRVPGLRREELAMLAGVSVSYYTRLEQGQSLRASAQVLDALARALRLHPHERAHLHDLAGGAEHRTEVRRSPVEDISPAVRELLSGMPDVPAIVLGRRSDVLGWNELGHALLAGHCDPLSPERPADRPNMARMIFTDAHCQELYVDWDAKAKAVVGNLRLLAGQHPEDALLASLIGELTMVSSDFASMWADHRVRACGVATYGLRHPLLGELTVTQQTFAVAEAPGQALVTNTAPAGSASAGALALLAQTARPSDAAASPVAAAHVTVRP